MSVIGAASFASKSLEDQFLLHVATVLEELDADLILLQEIAHENQIYRLSGMLDGKWEAMVSNGGSRSVAILGQRGRLYPRNGSDKNHDPVVADLQIEKIP